MEKWFVINKGADFAGIAKRFGISPVTARLIRNRGVMGDEAIARYLRRNWGTLRSSFTFGFGPVDGYIGAEDQ